MNNYYIYIYLDSRKLGLFEYGKYKFKYEPFYIGKGQNGQYKRINGRNEYFKRIINKIKESKLEPIVIKLKENLNEDDSFILEKKLIKLIGRKDLNEGLLLNFTDGGEGCSGCIPSEETRKKMSEKQKGENHPMFGRHHLEETKIKISKKNKGKYCGENNSNSTLTEKKVIEIWKYLNEGILTQKEIGEKFGVGQTTISNIKNKKYWTHNKIEER